LFIGREILFSWLEPPPPPLLFLLIKFQTLEHSNVEMKQMLEFLWEIGDGEIEIIPIVF
jgi:hypothetical protein